MIITPTQQRYLSIVGSIFAIIGGIYVVIQLKDYSSDIDLTQISSQGWALITFSMVVYAFICLLLAQSWRELLAHFGVLVSPSWVIRVYGISQIAKYIPGNVLHLAGRQVLGMSYGLPPAVLAKSLLWELLLIAGTGGVFLFLLLPIWIPTISSSVAILIFGFCFSIVVTICWLFISKYFAKAVVYYGFFLALTGLLFVAQISIITGNTPEGFLIPTIVASYVAAWLAGFVTPGAPAGIGVREIVILFLLQGTISNSELLLVILIGRIVSAGGDALYFLCSTKLPEIDNALISQDEN